MKAQELIEFVNSHDLIRFSELTKIFPSLEICKQGIVRNITPTIEITTFTCHCDDGFVKLSGMTKGFDEWSDFGIGYIKAEFIEI